MIKRISCLVLCLAVVFGVVSFNATQAWFAAGTDKHQYLTSGDIAYTLTGEFIDFDNTKILPGDELVDTSFSLTNSSSIDTQLRVKIVYKHYSAGYMQEFVYNSSDPTSVLQVTMDRYWERESDNYYYYLGDDHIVSTSDTQSIPLISSIRYSGANTNINNSGTTVYVKIVVESKQAYYVDWQTLDGN